MQREILLLSIRPTYTRRILDGSKTVELRRVRPSVEPGQEVLIYSSSPTMALLAHAVVAKVETAYPSTLWKSVRQAAGVTWTEYDDYFRGAAQAVGIWLRDVLELEEPIPLAQLRQRWPWFRPPQSYCFLQAHVEPSRRRVEQLAPRA